MKFMGISLLLLGAIFLESHSLAAPAACPTYSDFHWAHKNIGPYEISEWIGKGPKGWSLLKILSAKQPTALNLDSFSSGLDDNGQGRIYCNYTVTTYDGELFPKSISFPIAKNETCWKADDAIRCVKK